MKSATRESSKIIQAAVLSQMEATGCTMKSISAGAGFEKPNYLSMLSTTERIALAKIPALKSALPCLDQEALTAAVLTEMFPEKSAHDAILGLAKYLLAPPALEQCVLNKTAEVRAEAEASGLSMPDALDDIATAQITATLEQLAQRHARATYDL